MQPWFLLANEAHVTETAAKSGGLGELFTALGLNVQTLVLNGAAFLVLAWLLGKFVYPHLIRAIDARQAEAEAAVKLRQDAEAQLAEAQTAAAKIVSEARHGASDIMDNAKDEAERMVKDASDKAAKQAARIKAEATEQLGRDVEAARKALKADTVKLVAAATEAILTEKLDDKRDGDLIRRAVEGKA